MAKAKTIGLRGLAFLAAFSMMSGSEAFRYDF